MNWLRKHLKEFLGVHDMQKKYNMLVDHFNDRTERLYYEIESLENKLQKLSKLKSPVKAAEKEKK